jgi:hypothetical protein
MGLGLVLVLVDEVVKVFTRRRARTLEIPPTVRPAVAV